MFHTPNEDPVAVSKRAIKKYEADKANRAEARATLARETGYTMLAPGMF